MINAITSRGTGSKTGDNIYISVLTVHARREKAKKKRRFFLSFSKRRTEVLEKTQLRDGKAPFQVSQESASGEQRTRRNVD